MTRIQAVWEKRRFGELLQSGSPLAFPMFLSSDSGVCLVIRSGGNIFTRGDPLCYHQTSFLSVSKVSIKITVSQ